MTPTQRWARHTAVKRLARYFYLRKKTFRDHELADAILLHSGVRGLRRAAWQWLMTELTGQPNKEWRPWPLCGLLKWPRKPKKAAQ